MVDLHAATTFLISHARVLDRRRMGLLLGADGPEGVLEALDAYRNADGGYGWGLEPDLRSPESQPAAALHAFEIFAEVAPAVSATTVALCDWLTSMSTPDGGLPFALPVREPAGSAPWWAQADPSRSSLQITAAVAAQAQRVANHDPAVAAHPWLARATGYCLVAIPAMAPTAHAYELSFALQLLDAAADRVPEAQTLLGGLVRRLPPDGTMPVAGGLTDERLRPLDYTPEPDRPLRQLLAPGVVDAELVRLASQQAADGGWPVEWRPASPAAELEWRGYLTVRAVKILRDNGLLLAGQKSAPPGP